jgi:glycosyltransferase involved in cell wall biosynthesis
MLSLVIITFNEAQNIERCIRSVGALPQEVVVVDSFSSDDTVARALALGARVVQHAFAGHVEQKNYALSLATEPWVLSLDADEALSDKLFQSIKLALESPVADGYEVNRLNFFCGQPIYHGGWYPDRKLRLVRREKATWAGQNPHDKLVLLDGQAARLKGDLMHDSVKSIEAHIDQINKFSTIKAARAFAAGKRATIFDFWLRPLFKFIRFYVLRGGWRSGFYGLVIARNSAVSEWLKYAKLRALHRQKN